MYRLFGGDKVNTRRCSVSPNRLEDRIVPLIPIPEVKFDFEEPKPKNVHGPLIPFQRASSRNGASGRPGSVYTRALSKHA